MSNSYESTSRVSPEQVEIWIKMTPAEKIELFNRHMAEVRALKTAGVRHLHPDWTEKQVGKKVAEHFLYART